MKKESLIKIGAVGVFAIAFAFVEAAVVHYLRLLYYPEGFEFGIGILFNELLINVELVRELATLIMLLTVGILAGRTKIEKFGYFLFSFAIWDIFYYVWLKVILNWPESLLTWDLLFLVPIPWVGPVLAPIIYSFNMILIAVVIVNFQDRKKKMKIEWKEAALFLIGSAVILFTFMYDYGKIIIQGGFLQDYFNLMDNQAFLEIIVSYVPISYNWTLFIIGEALILISIYIFYLKYKRPKP